MPVSKYIAILVLLLLSLGEIIQPYILSLVTVVLNFMLIYDTNKFKTLSLFFIFIFPYILVSFLHFSIGMPLTLAYYDFDTDELYSNVLLVHALFLALIALSLPKIKRNIYIESYLPKNQNALVFTVFCIICIFILVFGRSGNNIFVSGGYGSVGANVTNFGGLAIYEYFLLFYLLAYVYAGTSRGKRWGLILVAIAYSVKGFLLGGRIEAIQMLLLAFILYADKPGLSYSSMLRRIAIPAGVFLVFGFVRATPNIGLVGTLSLLTTYYDTASYAFFGHHIDIYYSSTRLLGLRELDIIDTASGAYSFVLNFAAVVIPFSKLPAIASLTSYMKQDYPAGGGALVSSVYFIFLSYPGVIFIATYLSLVFKSAIKGRRSIFILYATMLLCTYPRWFAYSSIVIFKLALYVIPFYILTQAIIQTINIRKHENLSA